MMLETVPNTGLRLGLSMVIGAIFGGFAGFLIGVLGLGRFFDLTSLSLGSWLVFIVFMLLAVPTIRTITQIMNYGADLINKYISPWMRKVKEKWNER